MEYTICRCGEWVNQHNISVCDYCYNTVRDEEGKEYCDECVNKSHHRIEDELVCEECGTKDISEVRSEKLKEIIQTHFTPEKKYIRLARSVTQDMMKIEELQMKITKTKDKMDKLL